MDLIEDSIRLKSVNIAPTCSLISRSLGLVANWLLVWVCMIESLVKIFEEFGIFSREQANSVFMTTLCKRVLKTRGCVAHEISLLVKLTASILSRCHLSKISEFLCLMWIFTSLKRYCLTTIWSNVLLNYTDYVPLYPSLFECYWCVH